MSNPLINTKIYDPTILKVLDFCNIIQTQRILNTINGNGIHNLLVLRELQQKQILGEANQYIQVLNVKKISQLQSNVVFQNKKQLQNVQEARKIQPQSLTNSNGKQIKSELNINNIANSQTEKKNNKIKKKSKKFEKPTNIYKQKNEKQKKKMKFESPYKFQTPCKQKQNYNIQGSPQSRRSENQYVSIKELLARQSLMSNFKYHNKSSKNLNLHHISKQFAHSPINYRSLSLSSSPKKVIKVKYCKPPQLFKININEQNFHSIQQSPRVDQSAQVQFVKHRTQFWPFFKNKKGDIIETMQNLKDSKRIKQAQGVVQNDKVNYRDYPELKAAKVKEEKVQQQIIYQSQSQAKTKKQIGRQKPISPSKQQQQIKKTLKLIQQSKSGYNSRNNQEQFGQVNQRRQYLNRVEVQEQSQIKNNRLLEQRKKFNQQQKQKNMAKQLQKLQIKAIGNKYLEKILEKYKQNQMK